MFTTLSQSAPCPAAITLAGAALVIGVAADLRWRRIPNALTVPALAAVLAACAVAGGWRLAAAALAAALLCSAPLLLAALPGWVGMGDVKLIAVAGAAAGWPRALSVLLLVSVAGGVQAAAQVCWARARGRRAPRAVPYACAIAAGTAAAVWFG
jgi:Flp pilus assembly protein protease CpaA